MRIALGLAVLSLLAACSPGISPNAAATPDPSIAAGAPNASGPRIQPPPVTPPTPPGTNLPDFACADLSGGKTGVANTITARAAEVPAYDRFVLQFDPIVPTYSIKRQAKPVFPMGASGQTITLAGTTGVLVTVHSATGATTFQGDNDIVHNEFQVLKEARQTQDFEGSVSWGLGLGKPACMRAFVLSDPARLVVDFQITNS